MKIKTITSLRIETGPRTTWFLGFSRPFVVLIYRLPELATVCFHIWRWPEYRFTSFARRFGFVSYPVGFMSLHRMLSARASGFEKKNAWLPRLFTKINTVRLAPTPRIQRKRLVTRALRMLALFMNQTYFFFGKKLPKQTQYF